MENRVMKAVAAGLLIILAIIIIVIWAAFLRKGGNKDISDPLPESSTTNMQQDSTSAYTATTAVQTYIIGTWEDKLAVFMPPETTPYQLFDIYIATFPEEEQEKLKQGIVVNDEATLASLLEDYTS